MLTEPQCMLMPPPASAMQMHPRPLVAVDSAVKHTALRMLQGMPFNEIDPAGAFAGTMVAA